MKKFFIGLFCLIGLIATINFLNKKPSVKDVTDTVTKSTAEALASTINFASASAQKINEIAQNSIQKDTIQITDSTNINDVIKNIEIKLK